MDVDSPLISILLDPMVDWDDFCLWLNAKNDPVRTQDLSDVREVEETPVFAIPSSVSARFSCNELKLMRPEVGLAIVNFLRDQIATILDESPNNFNTPSKDSKVSSSVTSAAKKYDYSSPVKSVEFKGRFAILGEKNNKPGRIHGNKESQRPSNLGLKRMQLFPGEKDVNNSLFGEDAKKSILHKISTPNFNSAKVHANLEERFNSVQQAGGGTVAGVNIHQPINNQRRRSLGPELERSSTPTGKGRRLAPQILGDFIPLATKMKKKKGKASSKFQQTESNDKTRKAKSLSPTVVNGNTAAVEGITGFDTVPFVTALPNQAHLQQISKVTEAKFNNDNVWSPIVKEVQGEECQVSQGSSTINSEFKPSIEVQSTLTKTSDYSLVAADPNLVTNKFELDK